MTQTKSDTATMKQKEAKAAQIIFIPHFMRIQCASQGKSVIIQKFSRG
jgi:hypothetical protein